jgi:hypothetical protein
MYYFAQVLVKEGSDIIVVNYDAPSIDVCQTIVNHITFLLKRRNV